MTKPLRIALCLALAACSAAPTRNDPPDPPGTTQQASTRWFRDPGEQQQGTSLLGEHGANEVGVRTNGFYGTGTLSSIYVDKGELVARLTEDSGATRTLRGANLAGSYLYVDTSAGTFPLLIDAVRSAASEDIDPTGDTWLYKLTLIDAAKNYVPFCEPDRFGRTEAIPVAARWNDLGDRTEVSAADARFTFSCLRGVVAKCYGWGYRSWETPELHDLHQACTRAARADYCGDGRSHTMEGTPVNFYDLPSGYIPRYALTGFLFEGGWTGAGARCLSKNRWDTLPASPICTDFARRGPYTGQGKPMVCDSVESVLATHPDVHLFTESQLHAVP